MHCYRGKSIKSINSCMLDADTILGSYREKSIKSITLLTSSKGQTTQLSVYGIIDIGKKTVYNMSINNDVY